MKKKLIFISLSLSLFVSCVNLHKNNTIANMGLELKIDTANNIIVMDVVFNNYSNSTLNLLWSDFYFLLNNCNDSICEKMFFIKRDSTINCYKNPKSIPNYESIYRIVKINPKSSINIKLNITEYFDLNIRDYNQAKFIYSNQIKQFNGEDVYIGKLNGSVKW